MCLLRHILICSAIFNLLTFLIGLFLGIFREDFLLVSLILTAVGLLGMILFAVTWFNRPKVIHRPIYLVKRWKQEKQTRDTAITPDTTEAVMKNIRGIPFLIQAIQYSMETTYYRDVMSEMGEGVVRTSVIHTAPACTSILDSESDDETQDRRVTSRQQECRSSAEEQWLPFGESWRNEQLRLSLERGSSNLLVNITIFLPY
uniref:Inner membrane protein n=1 Tax=Heterorhabditis bacteriophora TaxID=37862 RepID=A0A1I7XCS6_HETBA